MMRIDLSKLNIKYPTNMDKTYVQTIIEKMFIQFLDHYKGIISEEDFHIVLNYHLKTFKKEKIERIKKFYPKILNKKYSDQHLLSAIINFTVDDKDLKNNIKYHLYAFIRVYDSLSDEIKNLIGNEQMTFDNEILCSKLQLLKRVLLDIEELLPAVEKLFGDTPKSSLHMNRNLDGHEIFRFTNLYANGILDYSNQTYFITYAFLLRQSIEIRVKKALGISAIIKNEQSVKITSDRFIDFIYNNDKINLPDVEKSLLRKIFYWANLHIHGGIVLYSWQFYLINDYLRPLFKSGNNGSHWHISGAISMSKDYYNGSFRDDLKVFLRNNHVDFDKIILWDKPEALLT